MSLRETLRGTGVALITPLNNRGTIDLNALGKVIDFVIEGGVEYLVTLGTTGETPVLTNKEKIEILRLTFDKARNRVPVVVGVGGNDTADLINDLESFPLEEA